MQRMTSNRKQKEEYRKTIAAAGLAAARLKEIPKVVKKQKKHSAKQSKAKGKKGGKGKLARRLKMKYQKRC